MSIPKPPVISVPIPAVNKWNNVGKHTKFAFVFHVAQCHTLQELDNWFTNPANGQGSSNAGVGPDGTLHEYVDPDGPDAPFANGLVQGPDAAAQALIARAAGVNLNYLTVSLEFVGMSYYNEVTLQGTPFVPTDAQIQKAAAYAAWACDHFGITADETGLLGHFEIYTGHAGCPGFDRAGWLRLEAAVTAALTPQPSPQPVTDWRALYQADHAKLAAVAHDLGALEAEIENLAAVAAALNGDAGL